MVVAPAVGLGLVVALLVVFGIGFFLTFSVASMIARQIEVRKRSSGLIPPVDQTWLDGNKISIMGGVVAVVLVVALLFIVPGESQATIWYSLTGLGIVCGLLSFFLFGSKSRSNPSTKTLPGPIDGRNLKPQVGQAAADQSPQSLKDSLYQKLLSKTKNDRDMANRLIEFERKRKPEASEAELIKNAIERWELDNR
jgi:hypothetical protein